MKGERIHPSRERSPRCSHFRTVLTRCVDISTSITIVMEIQGYIRDAASSIRSLSGFKRKKHDGSAANATPPPCNGMETGACTSSPLTYQIVRITPGTESSLLEKSSGRLPQETVVIRISNRRSRLECPQKRERCGVECYAARQE